MNRSIFDSPATKIIAVAVFLGAIAAWVFWPSHLPPPNEANRSWHPDGYSIIFPPGWEGGPEPHMGDLSMLGRLSGHPEILSSRSPGLAITNWKDPPDLEKLKSGSQFHDGEFEGHPALIYEGKWRQGWALRIVWKDLDRWFQIDMSVPFEQDMMHSDWWPYVQTFKYDPKMAKHDTTMPATVIAPVFPTSSP